MLQQLVIPGLLFAGTATALLAGIFLAFSDFIMRSLDARRPVSGIEAMQAINDEILRSIFIVLFLGSAPLAAAVLVGAFVLDVGAAAPWLKAGSLAYLLGVFAVTVLGNVPMNDRLKRLDADSAGARDYWRVYLRGWTRWNHLPSAASLFAAVAYLVAALRFAAA